MVPACLIEFRRGANDRLGDDQCNLDLASLPPCFHALPPVQFPKVRDRGSKPQRPRIGQDRPYQADQKRSLSRDSHGTYSSRYHVTGCHRMSQNVTECHMPHTQPSYKSEEQKWEESPFRRHFSQHVMFHGRLLQRTVAEFAERPGVSWSGAASTCLWLWGPAYCDNKTDMKRGKRRGKSRGHWKSSQNQPDVLHVKDFDQRHTWENKGQEIHPQGKCSHVVLVKPTCISGTKRRKCQHSALVVWCSRGRLAAWYLLTIDFQWTIDLSFTWESCKAKMQSHAASSFALNALSSLWVRRVAFNLLNFQL